MFIFFCLLASSKIHWMQYIGIALILLYGIHELHCFVYFALFHIFALWFSAERTNEHEKRKNLTLMLCALMLCACETRQRCSFSAYFLYSMFCIYYKYIPIDANSYPHSTICGLYGKKQNITSRFTLQPMALSLC